MSVRINLLFVVLLLLAGAQGGALAQVNPNPDILGLYFDTAATTTSKDTPAFVPFEMYLMAAVLYAIMTSAAALLLKTFEKRYALERR